METEYAWGRLKSVFKSACQKAGGEFFESESSVSCVVGKGVDYCAITLSHPPPSPPYFVEREGEKRMVHILAETLNGITELEAPDPGAVRVESAKHYLMVRVLPDVFEPRLEVIKGSIKPLNVKVERRIRG